MDNKEELLRILDLIKMPPKEKESWRIRITQGLFTATLLTDLKERVIEAKDALTDELVDATRAVPELADARKTFEDSVQAADDDYNAALADIEAEMERVASDTSASLDGLSADKLKEALSQQAE